MSGALKTWYSSRDLDAFAARGAVLSGELDVGGLERFAELLSADSGTVRASLGFAARRQGWWPIDLRVETCVQLTCQRCLEAFPVDVAGHATVGLIESESMEALLPDGVEAVVLDRDRLRPLELIEDELIMSLPLVPRHADTADCGQAAAVLEMQTQAGGTATGAAPGSET